MVHIEAIVLNKNLFRSKHGKSRTPSVSTYQHICNTPIQGSGILPSSRRLCQVHFPHNMPIPALTFSTSPRLAATNSLSDPRRKLIKKIKPICLKQISLIFYLSAWSASNSRGSSSPHLASWQTPAGTGRP